MLAEYDEQEGEEERHSSYSNERKKEITYEREHDSRQRGYPLIATDIVNISEKVFVPTKEYPKYNFLGKILGPKGSILRSIASSTKSKISILGRGSTRDPEKEEELSQSDDPGHKHLKEPLHVLIQVKAAKIDAHARMSAALKEINKFMVPVYEAKSQSTNGLTYGDKRLSPQGGSGTILRYGIPPPGAIIIGQPNIAVGDRKRSRREERSASRSIDLPKIRSPVSDSYKYRDTDDRGYNGYLDPKEASNYKYGDTATSRPGEKRTSITSDYSTKKYREESHGEKSYSTNDSESYYSANYSSRGYSDYYQQN